MLGMDQVPHCAVAVADTKIADLPPDEFVAAVGVAKKVAGLSPDEFVVAIAIETMTTDLTPDKFCLLIQRST
jgi:hypothetical protein